MTSAGGARTPAPQGGVVTFLFTDVEASTLLWQQQPERMPAALARHDEISRSAVENHRGSVVKATGDGFHAVFADPLDALSATLALQLALAADETTSGVALHVRCGLHAGVSERRDNDYFGSAVNRAARIASVAHGGQVLVSQAVVSLLGERTPADVDLRDLGEVRLKGLASPERVFQASRAGLRSEFPPLRALEAPPNNLAQPTTSFVGRERERADVEGLLSRGRLVTLLGVGGLGKTRLALQVASDAMGSYPDGVWLVELAPLADPRLVPQAVASALGVAEEAGRTVTEALVKHLRDRHLLLILDNCEHLIGACAELAARLLVSCARLKVLATSREPLHVAGETNYPLPALSVPRADSARDLAALPHFDAARLFVERAVAANQTFRLNSQNAAAAVEICRRLDGIPLAIELAAARVRSLGVDTIASRLSDRFHLLTAGDRSALPRQQTLQALIDWSYGLLTEDERTLLRRLAVFAGGWTLDAAEAIGAGGSVERTAVLDLLGNLVDKSLAELDFDGSRYRLLETIREYARERLEESGEAPAVRSRHLAFFLAFAEETNPKLVGPEQGIWLARLDAERENLHAAQAWCEHADGGGELGLRLVHALKLYLVNRGLLAMLRQGASDALARPGAQQRTAARCRALFALGQVDCFTGRYDEAQTCLHESLAIAREIGDRQREAFVLQALGAAAIGRGDNRAARPHLEKALAIVRERGDGRDVAAALTALAQLHRSDGDLDAAHPLYEQVLEIGRAIGDRETIAISLLNLAMASIARDPPDRVQSMLLEVMSIADETGSTRAGGSLLQVIAGFASSRGDHACAAVFLGAAEALSERIGLHTEPADQAFLAPHVAGTREALGAPSFEAAAAEGRALSYGDAIARAREWLQAR